MQQLVLTAAGGGALLGCVLLGGRASARAAWRSCSCLRKHRPGCTQAGDSDVFLSLLCDPCGICD